MAHVHVRTRVRVYAHAHTSRVCDACVHVHTHTPSRSLALPCIHSPTYAHAHTAWPSSGQDDDFLSAAASASASGLQGGNNRHAPIGHTANPCAIDRHILMRYGTGTYRWAVVQAHGEPMQASQVTSSHTRQCRRGRILNAEYLASLCSIMHAHMRTHARAQEAGLSRELSMPWSMRPSSEEDPRHDQSQHNGATDDWHFGQAGLLPLRRELKACWVEDGLRQLTSSTDRAAATSKPRACPLLCMRACVRTCVHVCVRACICMCACV